MFKKTAAAVACAALILMGSAGAAHAASSSDGRGEREVSIVDGAGDPADYSIADEISTFACVPGRSAYVTSVGGNGFQRASGANASITGGPGVTLTISRSTTFTVGGSITATADVGASVAWKLISAKLGGALAVGVNASFAAMSSSSGAWTVPSTYKTGRLEIGAIKYQGKVQKIKYNTGCGIVNVGTAATFNVPKDEWHFRHTKVA